MIINAGDTITVTNVVENFSPILSEHDTGYYRVLMEQVGNVYTVHTGDNMTRILEEFALPKEMRVKLAMIKAYENNSRKEEQEATPGTHTFTFSVWSPMDLYSSTFPSEFNDIGWRCKSDLVSDREFYCVVTTAETLDSLRGEP